MVLSVLGAIACFVFCGGPRRCCSDWWMSWKRRGRKQHAVPLESMIELNDPHFSNKLSVVEASIIGGHTHSAHHRKESVDQRLKRQALNRLMH